MPPTRRGPAFRGRLSGELPGARPGIFLGVLLGVLVGALPGAAAAVLLPGLLARPPSPCILLLWRAALALPIVTLPLLLAITRLQRHQNRAAAGLGAGPLDRLRWLWLPQLGPGIVVSLSLALVFALLFVSAGASWRH